MNDMEGKCKFLGTGLMIFTTVNAKCTLKFNYNTQFEFKHIKDNKIELSRKDIWIEISEEEFNNKFKIIERYSDYE